MAKFLSCPNNRNILGNHINYVFSHWQDVDYFVVGESNAVFTTFRLEVVFLNRKRVSIYFGSLADAWEVLHQPLFSRLAVYWFGRRYEIKHENNPRAN